MTEKMYEVPESQLFRLLEICSNKNNCKTFGSAHCQCSRPNDFIPLATKRQRNKRVKK